MKTLFIALTLLLSGPAFEFDKTVHDFGRITLRDGEQSCTFTVTNNGEEEMSILAVTTTCGCTKVKWTRETIAPGKSGQIQATFTNDEGPYPFDKTLTVYLTGSRKPVVLHLRGVVSK